MKAMTVPPAAMAIITPKRKKLWRRAMIMTVVASFVTLLINAVHEQVSTCNYLKDRRVRPFPPGAWSDSNNDASDTNNDSSTPGSLSGGDLGGDGRWTVLV